MEGAAPPGTQLEVVGAEIDPGVVELGRRFFDLESGEDRQVWVGDGRAALRLFPGPFDQVVLDAYANNMEIPPHLASVEFFREVRGSLREGGWLVINAAGFGLQDPLVSAVSETVAAAFQREVLCVRVPFSRNCVLFVRSGEEVITPDDAGWNFVSEAHQGLLGRLALEGAWRLVPVPEEAPLRDDQSPLDQLQLESVLAGRGSWLDG